MDGGPWLGYSPWGRKEFDTTEQLDSLTHLCAVLYLVSQSCLTVTTRIVTCQAPLSMGIRGKNTRVGCHPLLQRIFKTQGLNPGLLH